MRLNQGIRKYREAATSSKSKASSSNKAAVTSKATHSKKVSHSKSEKKVHNAGKDSKKSAHTENQILAVDLEEQKAVEEAARERAQLQKEIANELARESDNTSTLVKDDFTPNNSSREKLVVEYAPLIKYIAQKIAVRLPANIELDDLISSGVIGLMDAIEKYDSTRDNKFKTYAEFRVRGAILDELRAQDWVPRSIREKAKILERCYIKLEQEKGRHATDEEVCASLGITQAEFHELLNQVKSVALLSYEDFSAFSRSDKRTLHGYGNTSSRAVTPFSEVNVAALKKSLAVAIKDLPEKQRIVLSLYYYEDLNLKEIGKVLDVTESRVSQLHTQAVLRLKAKLRSQWDELSALLL